MRSFRGHWYGHGCSTPHKKPFYLKGNAVHILK